MNYLGIDYGEKRVGLAAGNELGVATPLAAAVEKSEGERIAHIGRVARERQAGALVVGYPLNMDGTAGPKAREVDAFIAKLEARLGLPVHRSDERLTSEAAARAGRRAKGRGVKARQRERASGELDSRAAALILQDFLDLQDTAGTGLCPDDDDAL